MENSRAMELRRSASLPAITKTFTFQAEGDQNDVFYWIGTRGGKDTWQLPLYVPNGINAIAGSNLGDGFGVTGLFDRNSTTVFHSNNNGDTNYNRVLVIDFGPNRKFGNITRISVRQRHENPVFTSSLNIGVSPIYPFPATGTSKLWWDISISNSINTGFSVWSHITSFSSENILNVYRYLVLSTSSSYLVLADIQVYCTLIEL